MSRPMHPEDLFRLQAVGEVTVHPLRDVAAFTVTWPDKETDENRSVIHLLESGSSEVLTGGHCDTGPRFSPQGSQLGFLLAEPKKPAQVAVVDLTSRRQVFLSDAEDGVTGFEWLDASHLVIQAPTRPEHQRGLDEEELKRLPRTITSASYRFNARGWIHDRPRNIQILAIDTGEIRQLTDPAWDCADIAVAPHGTSVLVIAPTDEDADLTGANHVWAMDPVGGDVVKLTTAGYRWSSCGWTQDGAPFALGAPGGEVRLDQPHLLDPTGKQPQKAFGSPDLNCTALLGGAARPISVSGAVLCPGIRGATITVDRYDLETASFETVAGGHFVVGSFAATADGDRILAAVSTPERPAELWEFRGSDSRVVHSLNDDVLPELDIVTPEVLSVPSTDGVHVEALLLRPPPSAAAQMPGPGLVYIHGGPTSIYGHYFLDEFQLAASAGYTVIAGNPRGSDGYGEAWARAVVGRVGTVDWEDIQALADRLATDACVDADRIGIGGGSYGGFMTAWAIGHSDRFTAALVERCVANWHSFAGTSDIGPYFLPMLLDATVESDVQSVTHQSPLTWAAQTTTPTLIIHSEEDWRCPIEQAEQLFAAYRRNGVDVTLVRFPGENHEFSRSGSPKHRVERFGIIHEFFDRWLKD